MQLHALELYPGAPGPHGGLRSGAHLRKLTLEERILFSLPLHIQILRVFSIYRSLSLGVAVALTFQGLQHKMIIFQMIKCSKRKLTALIYTVYFIPRCRKQSCYLV